MNNQLKQVSRSAGGVNAGFMQTNKYMQALGITMRYAFAGAVIQQIRLAYQNLKLFQAGLADVVAIGTEPNGMPLMSRHLEELGNAALRTSAKTATSAADILDTYRAIYSSIPGVGTNQVQSLGTLATKGAALSETDPRTFIQSIIGMKNSFGLQMGDMKKISNEFFTVIQRSINMSGDEWAHYSGRLITASKVANISLEEMNQMMIAITRSGGTAAVNVRHLNQFLMRARFPAKRAQESYQEAGLTPEKLVNMSGPQVFIRLLEHASKLSGHALPTLPANFDTLSNVQKAGVVQAQAKQAQKGLEGPGLVFLQKAIGGRMESLRAFIALAQQMRDTTGDAKALADSTDKIKIQFDRFIQQKPLEAMGIAMTDFTTGLLQTGAPFFRIMANLTKKIADWSFRFESFAIPHTRGVDHRLNRGAAGLLNAIGIPIGGQTVQRMHLGTDAALAAAVLGGSVLGGGLLKKLPFGKMAGGAGKVARAGLIAEALPGALSGSGNNGTRALPFWVVIHPMSNAFVDFGGSTHKDGGMFKWLKKLAGPVTGAAAGLAGRVGLKTALRVAGDAAVPLTVTQELINRHAFDPLNRFFGLMPDKPRIHKQQSSLMQPVPGGTGSFLNGILGSGTGPSRVSGGSHHLTGEIHLKLEPTGKLEGLVKPIDKKIPWPTELWGVAAPPPTSRGKPADKRTH